MIALGIFCIVPVELRQFQVVIWRRVTVASSHFKYTCPVWEEEHVGQPRAMDAHEQIRVVASLNRGRE